MARKAYEPVMGMVAPDSDGARREETGGGDSFKGEYVTPRESRLVTQDPAAVAAYEARRAATAAEAELAANNAASRAGIEALIQQFQDIATGKVKSNAEQVFEDQYRRARGNVASSYASVEGINAQEAAMARAGQSAQLGAYQQQDQRVLQNQIRGQAQQAATQLGGWLREGDISQAQLDAANQLGKQGIDANSAMNEASRRWLMTQGDYGNRMRASTAKLDDFSRDRQYYESLIRRGAESGGSMLRQYKNSKL